MTKRKADKAQAKQTTTFNKNNLVINTFSPLTATQKKFFTGFDKYDHHLLIGCAGTGKTFLALYKAFQELAKLEKTKIVIFRSSVASRDQGFLPGTLAEKMAVFETPYRTIVNKLFHRDDAYDLLKKQGVILFESTSYQRGNTLDDAIVIIDEFQSMTFHEIDTLITRVGDNTRLIICGDMAQQDLVKTKEKNVHKVLPILTNLPSFNVYEFTLEDIVRSGLVKEYLLEKYKHYPNGVD